MDNGGENPESRERHFVVESFFDQTAEMAIREIWHLLARKAIPSADWPGALADGLRQTYGPECAHPLVLSVTCGNINPWDPYDPHYERDHQRMGALIAGTAQTLVERGEGWDYKIQVLRIGPPVLVGRVRSALLRLGQASDFTTYLEDLKARHRRLRNFSALLRDVESEAL